MKTPYQLGYEKIKCGEWWILVGHYLDKMGKKAPIFHRKARHVLELTLHTRLSCQDSMRIRFVDGNKLNCCLSNLVLVEETAKVRCCVLCGNLKVYSQCYWKGGVNKYCKKCYNQIHIGGSRLSSKDVALIRSVTHRRHEDDCQFVSRWFNVKYHTLWKIRNNQTWKGILPMSHKESWKQLLIQHDKLVKSSTAILYDRVTLLKEIYSNPEYVAAQKLDSKDPMELMNAKVLDTCANFTELLQILKMYPNRRQWLETSLPEMRSNMLASLRAANRPSKPKTPRTTATLSEVKELHVRIDHEAQESASLRKQLKIKDRMIAKLESALDQAQATIREMTNTIARLKSSKVRAK